MRQLLCVALIATGLVVAPPVPGAGAVPGELDPSFAGTGYTTTGLQSHADAVAVQPDGKIVSVGTADRSDGTNTIRRFAVSRHLPDGSLDAGFGTAGVVEVQVDGTDDHAHAVAVEPDGRIVVAGESGGDMAVIRLLPSGALDTSFDGDGKVVLQVAGDPMPISVASSVLLAPGNKIVVGGFARAGGTGSASDLKVVRLNGNGSFDTTFGGGDGVALADSSPASTDVEDITDLALDGADRIVAVGHTSPNASPGQKDWVIARFDGSGALDPTFDGDGVLIASPSGLPGDDIATGVAVDPGGRIVVAGEGAPNTSTTLPRTPIQVLRLLDNGARDTSFDGDGRTGAGSAGNFRVRDLVLESDGDIVVGSTIKYENGSGGHFDAQIQLFRFTSDGSGGSSPITNLTTTDEFVNGLALQADGKIVAAGGGDPGFLLLRVLGDSAAPPLPPMGRIAFASDRTGNGEIWVAQDNGTFPTNVSNSASTFEGDPAFSPDGTKIAFTSNRRSAGDRDVYWMNADGTDVRAVPFSTIWDADPEWSPDGTKIVFTRDMGGQNFDLFVYDTNQPESATNPMRLTTGSRAEGFPSWSPDGSTIAYRAAVIGSSGDERIEVIPAAGGTAQVLIDGPAVDTTPSWSPNGLKIAFTSTRDGNAEVYVADADGSDPVRTTTNAASDYFPDWSPDGTRLVFQRSAPDATHLVIADVDGTNELVVATEGNNQTPSWVGDGLQLTVDQPVTPASPSSLPLDRISLSPNSPAPGPDGLPPLIDASILGLPPLIDASIAGLPLQDASIAGLPPLIDASILGLPPLIDASIAGLPPLVDASIAGLPPLIDASIAGLPLLDASIAGLPPIPSPGGWEGILALGSPYAGLPLENISLREVLALLPAPGQPFTYDAQRYIAALCLCDIDWSRATHPLRTIGAVPLALSRTSFRMITLPAGDAGWCQRFQGAGFPDCGTAFGGLDASPFAYQAVGGDITKLPLNGLRLSAIDLSASALIDYRLDNIDVAIDLDNTPLGAVPIAEIPAATRDLVVNCSSQSSLNCANGTLAQAGDVGMIRTGARIRHLGTFNSAGAFVPGPTLGSFALGEVVFTLLPTPPIEDISYEALRLQYYGGPTSRVLDYHLRYNHRADTAVSGFNAQVTLPASFAPVAGSSRLTVALGSTVVESDTPLPDPTFTGGILTWDLSRVNLQRGTSIKLDFQARPGIRTGEFTSSAALAGIGLLEAVHGQAPVSVIQNHEFTPLPITEGLEYATAEPAMGAGQVMFTHLSPGDVDTFRLPVPVDPNNPDRAWVGARFEVIAGHFTNDNDLVVYLPSGTSTMTPSRTTTPSVTLRGQPVVAPPRAPVPVADAATGLEGGPVKPAEQAVNDVPVRSDLAVGGISASHGLYDERVEVEVPEGAVPGDYFTVELRSYNETGSDFPATLRARQIDPVRLPDCAARRKPYAAQSLPAELVLPAPTAIRPTGTPEAAGGATETLVLFSPRRMFQSFGGASTIELKNEILNPAFLGMSQVRGQVINLDADQFVSAAFARADAEPCSIDAANGVVREINALIDRLLVAGTDYQLRSVVIVGTDEVIPHQRVVDYTRKFNERLYRPDLDFTTKDGAAPPKSNALLSALARGYVVSDAAYGDLAPYVFDGGFVNVPQLAVGRIVETSAQAADAFRRFRTFGGTLDPKSALSAGYDFVTDNAERVDAAFAANGIGDRRLLAGDSWTTSDYVSALNTTDGVRSLVNTNGHYNHFLMQPATGSQLFSTSPLPSGNQNLAQSVGSLAGRGFLTMSCHSALNVADILLGSPTAAQATRLADWPQAYDAKGAAFLLGASGYGYGDKYAVGYGERVVSTFAAALRPGASVADAFIEAQQEYFSSLGVNGVYDNKVLQETMLFGFPMYRIQGTPATAQASAAATPAPEPVAGVPGLSSATVTHTPALQARPQVDGTSYFTDGSALPQLTHDQPIVARGEDDITVPGKTAAGAFVTQFSYRTVSGFKNSISNPIADSSALEAGLRPDDTLFPANLNRVGTKTTPAGTTQALVVHSTQFAAAGTSGGATVGTLRKYGDTKHQVFYVDDANAIAGQRPAAIQRFESQVVDNVLSVDLRVVPDSSGVPVKRVLVLYAELGGAPTVVTSKQLELTRDPSNGLRWTGSVALSKPGAVELFAQALKANGLVSLSINKRAGVGNASPPVISITAPTSKTYRVGESVRAAYSCLDPHTGGPALNCSGPVSSGDQIDTATPGLKTFTVTASTATGSEMVSETVTYSVHYQFDGFLSPIKNRPTRNSTKAGSTVPVKWRLLQSNGAPFGGLTAADVELVFRQVPCSAGQSITLLPLSIELVSSLQYDPITGQYHVNVKTPATFKNTCQEMSLTFYKDEASRQSADFEFK